jgi:hypothetical protein
MWSMHVVVLDELAEDCPTWYRLKISIRSTHSRRAVATKRWVKALARGGGTSTLRAVRPLRHPLRPIEIIHLALPWPSPYERFGAAPGQGKLVRRC